MFNIEGEYYCINGCLEYPLSNKKVFKLIQSLASGCIVDEVQYYRISPKDFKYDDAIDGILNEDTLRHFLITVDFPYTITSIDFYSYNFPCRLIFEFLDNDYYGISLLFSSDVLSLDSIRERIIIPFYQSVDPVYGTNGVEKAVFSLNQIDVTDSDIFNSDFMLSKAICEKIGKKCIERAIGIIPIKDVGIYFPKQTKKIFESIFHKFLQCKS